MEIRLDDLSGPEIAALIGEHLHNMTLHSPPESIHALNLEKLKGADITFWSVWEQDCLVGCGALKELSGEHGEIKSMRTASAHLRKGAARLMLGHIMEEARRRGYRRLSLETGARTIEAFIPAIRLYESFGFEECEPFADYILDPNSLFMTIEL